MAERRMFSKSITTSGRFLKLSASARLLYYDLGMLADDDGFVEAFGVIRQTQSSEDDLLELAAKGFVTVLNDELVAHITDWNENNKIRKDRRRPSIYSDLLDAAAAGCSLNAVLDDRLTTKCQPSDNQLTTICQPSDNQLTTICQPTDNHLTTQDRIGKDRLGQFSTGKDSLSPSVRHEVPDVSAVASVGASRLSPRGVHRTPAPSQGEAEGAVAVDKAGEKVKKKPAKRPDVFASYAGGDAELLTALRDFEKMRRSINKPLGDRAKEILVKKLEVFPPGERVAVLEQSIEHCWQSVYALKEPEAGPGKQEKEDPWQALRNIHAMFEEEEKNNNDKQGNVGDIQSFYDVLPPG